VLYILTDTNRTIKNKQIRSIITILLSTFTQLGKNKDRPCGLERKNREWQSQSGRQNESCERQPDQAGEAACAAGSYWWTDPQPKKSAQ
jgi:hypothetical protein